jgi:hypothetical protein
MAPPRPLLGVGLALVVMLLRPTEVGGSCTMPADCPARQYCDGYHDGKKSKSGLCSDCDYITPSRCDAVGGDCCSAAFLAQCPSNPHRCAGEPCAKHADCTRSQYCDLLGACSDCSYLTTKCDAVDRDCCSVAFLDQVAPHRVSVSSS